MLTEEQSLDEWHEAKEAHKAASDGEKDEAWQRVQLAEIQAIRRFGLGKHMKAYKERFSDAPSSAQSTDNQ
ncbi:MAG: hypothetical protein ABR905_21885 [Terracidiphilus sp.]|jgi:hypothetical protein